MALLKRADSERMARPALVLDLGDLRRQAEELERRTRERTGEIIEQGRAERARLLAGAEEQGHAAGHEKGFAQGLEEGRARGQTEATASLRAEGESVQRAWEAALGEFLAQRDEMLTQARTDVLLLALMIARRVVRRVVDVDPRVVEEQLAAALSLTTRPTSLVIEVHPDDAALAGEILPELIKRFGVGDHASLATSSTIGRGSVVIRTRGGEVDASIDTQLQRIVEAIVPAAELDRARRVLDDAPREPGPSARADQDGAS